MAKQINDGVGGVVKKVKEVPFSIGGVVKKAKKGVCSIGGVVKEFFVSETVLWNGSSLQNGATYKDSNNRILQYSYSSGALSGKSIVLKFKNSWSSNSSGYIYITAYTNSTSVKKVNKFKQAWTAGQEYVYSFDSLEGFSSVTMLGVYFTYVEDGETINSKIADIYSYIAIR